MYLSIVWHFHQPIYKEPSGGEYILPWVNLHATKNYHPMGELVREAGFPCTFNFVPCLLEQLQEYASGTANDPYERALEKVPGDLTFADLRLLRRISPGSGDAGAVQKRALEALFSPLDGAGDDSASLLVLRKKLHDDLIPLFRRLKKKNLAEITTSPYYHPLLPLVFDSSCSPDEKAPATRFRHPEDGEAQLRSGKDYFRKVFGFEPDGLWPSEGAVSREVAAAAARTGFAYALSDENVLWKSLGEPADRSALYKPYTADGLPMFFRDRELSDLLSFSYQKWPEKDAVADFLLRLEARRRISPDDAVCTVVLDGENPWECYPGNGVPFLREFYGRLLEADGIKPILPGAYLRSHGPGRDVTLVPGTWLGNFSKWVGDPAKNRAWEELAAARTRCGPVPEIYVAEGSDWFWWYGEPDKEEFDFLFKSYVCAALRRAGQGGRS
jgi:alpha-amylase/alpha-mannosidase (GH57 family)